MLFKEITMGLLSISNRRQKKKKKTALLKKVHVSYLSTEIFYRRNQIFIGKDGYYFNSGKTLLGIMWLFYTLQLAK